MSAGRILIVEDDSYVRDLLLEIMEDAGFEAQSAENGQVALDRLEEGQPDLILLDLMVPAMDGMTFRAKQRVHPTASNIPVIVLTAGANPESLQEEMGVVAIVSKPFAMDDLQNLVLSTILDSQVLSKTHQNL